MPDSIDDLVQTFQKMSVENQNRLTTVQAAKSLADFLPTFSGESFKLESFIQRCDKYYNTYGQTVDNTLNDFSYNVICSKLQGDVLDFVMCRPDLNTWPLVRESLRNHFGDRIDRQTLTRDFLHLTKNRNENILDFLSRISHMKSRVEIKINAERDINYERKRILMEQNEGNSIDILLANVDEKTRTILDIKVPKTFTEASDIISRLYYNDQRINSLNPENKVKTKTNFIPHKPHNQNSNYFLPQNSYYKPRNNFRSNFGNNFHRSNFPHSNFSYQPGPYKPSFPSQPINMQPRQIQRHYPTNEQVFGKPKNVFDPKNAPRNESKPEPMSTTSRNPSFNQKFNNNSFIPRNNHRTPNFTFEELYNLEDSQSNECSTQEPQTSLLEEENYYYPEIDQRAENFRKTMSQIPDE